MHAPSLIVAGVDALDDLNTRNRVLVQALHPNFGGHLQRLVALATYVGLGDLLCLLPEHLRLGLRAAFGHLLGFVALQLALEGAPALGRKCVGWRGARKGKERRSGWVE